MVSPDAGGGNSQHEAPRSNENGPGYVVSGTGSAASRRATPFKGKDAPRSVEPKTAEGRPGCTRPTIEERSSRCKELFKDRIGSRLIGSSTSGKESRQLTARNGSDGSGSHTSRASSELPRQVRLRNKGKDSRLTGEETSKAASVQDIPLRSRKLPSKQQSQAGGLAST